MIFENKASKEAWYSISFRLIDSVTKKDVNHKFLKGLRFCSQSYDMIARETVDFSKNQRTYNNSGR